MYLVQRFLPDGQKLDPPIRNASWFRPLPLNKELVKNRSGNEWYECSYLAATKMGMMFYFDCTKGPHASDIEMTGNSEWWFVKIGMEFIQMSNPPNISSSSWTWYKLNRYYRMIDTIRLPETCRSLRLICTERRARKCGTQSKRSYCFCQCLKCSKTTPRAIYRKRRLIFVWWWTWKAFYCS